MKRALTITVMMGAVASVGFGQVRMLPQGHPMDANPQVGSGGSNTPVPGYVPVNGNDIFYGNVGGLKYFHGNVPYSNPLQMQGGVGNSALTRFERQSSTGAPPGGPYLGQTTVFYSPRRAVSGMSGNFIPAQSGVELQVVPGTSISPLSRYSTPVTVYTSVPVNTQVFARRYDDLTAVEDPNGVVPSGIYGFRAPLRNAPAPGSELIEKDRKAAEAEALRTDLGKQWQVAGRIDPLPAAVDLRIRGRVEQAMENEAFVSLQEQLSKKKAGTTTAPATGPATLPGGKEPSGSGFGPADPKKAISAKDGKPLKDVPKETLQAGKQVKPIETFRGGKVSVFNEFMGIAEKEMKEGRYLDAARTYQEAAEFAGDNPLPLVGRAHVQMASGMYLAAGEDLRALFEGKPELIAVHYDLRSFLPEKRVGYVLEDLTKLAHGEKSNATATFLLSYVAYQLGRKEELKAELKYWKEHDARNEWVGVLEKAWGE